MKSIIKKAKEIVTQLYERNTVSWNDLDREVVFALQALNAEVQRMEALAQPDYPAVKTYHEGKPVYVTQTEPQCTNERVQAFQEIAAKIESMPFNDDTMASLVLWLKDQA